jgi:hypothetical protein
MDLSLNSLWKRKTRHFARLCGHLQSFCGVVRPNPHLQIDGCCGGSFRIDQAVSFISFFSPKSYHSLHLKRGHTHCWRSWGLLRETVIIYAGCDSHKEEWHSPIQLGEARKRGACHCTRLWAQEEG